MSDSTAADPPSLEPALWRAGALYGGLAGLLGAWLDVASTILWLSSPQDQRRLVAVFSLLGFGAFSLLGALSARVLAPALGQRSWRPLAWRALALVSPAALSVGLSLFTGGRMRRLPGLIVLRPLGVALVALAFTATVLAFVRAIALARARSPRARAVLCALATGCAMALHAADHRVFARLYEHLHAVLGVATALALAFALAMVSSLQRWASSRLASSRLALALLGLAPASLVLALALLGRWDNVRAEVFATHAPFVRHVAIALEALAAPRTATSAAATESIQRERAQREREARAREQDPTLPIVAGAHVLLLSVDALRADRSYERTAPTIARLASQGARFARAYAQAPHSSYSITTLHTGEFLHETVALGQPQPLETMAQRFASVGYRTAALYTQGIFFTEGEKLTAYRDAHLGFSRSEHRDMDARETTDAAIREVDESVRRGEPPTLLWAHYFDAHEPYRGRGATPVERYDDAVRSVDRELARLVSHAQRAWQRPLVLAITADHGEEFGEHGGVYHGSALYEEQVRVPLVIVAPGVRATVVNRPVGLVDVAPTLLALAGVARPQSMRGRDLRPWMLGREGAQEPVFSAVNTRAMVVLDGHKLVADLRWGVRELYDLARDPDERTNLAQTQPARRAELESELFGWIASLGGASGDEARVRMGDRGAIEPLVQRALSSSASLARRVSAVDALATLRDREVSARLAPLLDCAHPSLRDSAAIALGISRDSRSRDALAALVTTDDPALRGRAALALSTLADPRATRALVELARHGDERERSDAVDGLARLGANPVAVAPLLEALEDDHLRYRAALALGVAGRGHTLSVIARVAREDRADDARAWAAAGLGLTRDPRAYSLLIERMTNDAAAQRFAASALGALVASGVAGEGALVWDARVVRGGPWRGCAAMDDDAPWPTLGAVGCEAAGVATVVLRGRGADLSRGARVWLRARGSGPLVVRHRGRELLRFTLEDRPREWRAELGAAALDVAASGADASAELTLEASAPWWLGHVVVLGR